MCNNTEYVHTFKLKKIQPFLTQERHLEYLFLLIFMDKYIIGVKIQNITLHVNITYL